MVGERIRAWAGEVRRDARGIVDAVEHRVQYGDPPIFTPGDDLGLSAFAMLQAKKQRIRRRRALVGIEYREFHGPGQG